MSDALAIALRVHRAPPDLFARALRDRRRRGYAPRAAVWIAGLLGVVAGRALGPAGAAEAASAPVPLAPVRLVLHAPDAERVGVAGTWNGWSAAATPMTPVGDGVFHVALDLPHGEHAYVFVVDGQRWQAEPTRVPADGDPDALPRR